MDHIPVNVGQPEVAPGISVGQALVVKLHQVENGGVKIVHVNRILDSVEAELVRGPINLAALGSPGNLPARTQGTVEKETGGVSTSQYFTA